MYLPRGEHLGRFGVSALPGRVDLRSQGLVGRQTKRVALAGSCRRPCLVANRATLPQKWPPPPRNMAYSCEWTATTKPTELFFWHSSALPGRVDLRSRLGVRGSTTTGSA